MHGSPTHYWWSVLTFFVLTILIYLGSFNLMVNVFLTVVSVPSLTVTMYKDEVVP